MQINSLPLPAIFPLTLEPSCPPPLAGPPDARPVVLGDAASLAVMEQTLSACCRRLEFWQVPGNWSRRDWVEELRQVASVAADRALLKYDSGCGIPLGAFIYMKIRASARTRQRQELD